METTEENRLEIRDCMGEIPQANRVKCPTSPIIRNARFFSTRHHHRFPGVPIIKPFESGQQFPVKKFANDFQSEKFH